MSSAVNIVVYFTEKGEKAYPFDNPGYLTSYLDFFDASLRRRADLNFYVARGNSYLGNGFFQGGEKYDVKKRGFKSVKNKLFADIIYNKGDLLLSSNEKGNIVNAPQLDRLCKDKMLAALFFPEYSPSTIEVASKEELLRAVFRMSSRKVVIKPVRGQEGEGVRILLKSEVKKLELAFKEPFIVQEFLDTSAGIKGITTGTHDLRVSVMNGEIVETFVRMPKKGGLVANLARGGSLKELNVKDLPAEIVKIVKIVDKRFEMYFPRIYSVDFGWTQGGPKIIELNSQPGLPSPGEKVYRHWHEKLLETLLSSLRK